MKRLFYSSLLLLLVTAVKAQQINQNTGPVAATESNDVIWKEKNIFNDGSGGPDAQKIIPRDPSPVNSPFDGGLLALIATGIFYGGRQLKKNRIPKLGEYKS